jgi:hypothetical protein
MFNSVKITDKRSSKLKCSFIHYHPLLVIAPVKMEEVFDNPPIWVYYDVISGKDFNFIKNA